MTPYETLQQAMANAFVRDKEVWAERSRLRAKCATLLYDLLQQLRAELGLAPDDATHQVFFCDPDKEDPDPDEPIRALTMELFEHRIRLDVEIKAPNASQGTPPHIVYVILKICERNDTQYRITFEGAEDEHAVVVDTVDPRTFAQFSNKLIAAILNWFDTDAIGRNSLYVRSSVGFSPPR